MSTDVGKSTRSRSHEWDDPAPLAGAATAMSGLEFLRAMVSELPAPPIMSLVGARIDSVREW